MNRMYRYTRHVYDATRRYYLFGRDRLLDEMRIGPGDEVLEIGCGTARNLILLNRRYPEMQLHGLDASLSMLASAGHSVARRGLSQRIVLRHCLAEQLDHLGTFDLPRPFDVIFFSYSLSMMPTWQKALDAAMANLAPEGRIYIVDFWDQAGLPRLFAAALKRWLALFHVHYRPELLDHLYRLRDERGFELELNSIGARYAYLAVFQAPGI